MATILDELVTRLKLVVDGRGAKNADRDLEKLKKRAKETQRGLNDLRRTVLETFSAYGVFSGLRSLAGGLVETNRSFGVLRSRLTTVEGSAAKAASAFRMLRQFAKDTPFEVENLTDAYTRLKSQGIEPTSAVLSAFGDIAAGMGKDIVQFSEAANDAVMGEFERMKEFGIKMGSEGDNVKITFKGVTTTVKKSKDDIVAALVRIGNTHFAGAMQRQSKTLDGALSNLSDATSELFLQIGDAGLTPAIHRLALEMTNAAGESGGLGKAIGEGLGEALNVLTDLLVDVVRELKGVSKTDVRAFFERVAKATRQLFDTLKWLASVLKTVVDLFGGPKGLLIALAAAKGVSLVLNTNVQALGKSLVGLMGGLRGAGLAAGAFAVALVGAGLIVAHFEKKIDALRAKSRALMEDVIRNEEKLAQGASGEVLQRRKEQIEATMSATESRSDMTPEGRAEVMETLRAQHAIVSEKLEGIDAADRQRFEQGQANLARSKESMRLRKIIAENKRALAKAKAGRDKKGAKSAAKALNEAQAALAEMRGEAPPAEVGSSVGKSPGKDSRNMFGGLKENQSEGARAIESRIEELVKTVEEATFMRARGGFAEREAAAKKAGAAAKARFKSEVERGNLPALGGEFSAENKLMRDAGLLGAGQQAPPVLTVTINRNEYHNDVKLSVHVKNAKADAQQIASTTRAAVREVLSNDLRQAAIQIAPRQKV